MDHLQVDQIEWGPLALRYLVFESPTITPQLLFFQLHWKQDLLLKIHILWCSLFFKFVLRTNPFWWCAKLIKEEFARVSLFVLFPLFCCQEAPKWPGSHDKWYEIYIPFNFLFFIAHNSDLIQLMRLKVENTYE